MTFAGGNRRDPKKGRGRPRAAPGGGADEPRVLGTSIDAYLTTEGLGGMRLLSKIASKWSDVVGENVAKHSAPRSLEGKELVVSVDHPSRVTELAFLAPKICERVADQLGYRAVESVKGRVDSRFGVD